MEFNYPKTFLRSALARDPFALGDLEPEDVLRIQSEFPDLFDTNPKCLTLTTNCNAASEFPKTSASLQQVNSRVKIGKRPQSKLPTTLSSNDVQIKRMINRTKSRNILSDRTSSLGRKVPQNELPNKNQTGNVLIERKKARPISSTGVQSISSNRVNFGQEKVYYIDQSKQERESVKISDKFVRQEKKSILKKNPVECQDKLDFLKKPGPPLSNKYSKTPSPCNSPFRRITPKSQTKSVQVQVEKKTRSEKSKNIILEKIAKVLHVMELKYPDVFETIPKYTKTVISKPVVIKNPEVKIKQRVSKEPMISIKSNDASEIRIPRTHTPTLMSQEQPSMDNSILKSSPPNNVTVNRSPNVLHIKGSENYLNQLDLSGNDQSSIKISDTFVSYQQLKLARNLATKYEKFGLLKKLRPSPNNVEPPKPKTGETNGGILRKSTPKEAIEVKGIEKDNFSDTCRPEPDNDNIGNSRSTVLHNIAKELVYAEVLKHLDGIHVKEKEERVTRAQELEEFIKESDQDFLEKSTNSSKKQLSVIQELAELTLSLSTPSLSLSSPQISKSVSESYCTNHEERKVFVDFEVPTPDTPDLSHTETISRHAYRQPKDSPATNNNDGTDCSEISDFVFSEKTPTKSKIYYSPSSNKISTSPLVTPSMSTSKCDSDHSIIVTTTRKTKVPSKQLKLSREGKQLSSTTLQDIDMSSYPSTSPPKKSLTSKRSKTISSKQRSTIVEVESPAVSQTCSLDSKSQYDISEGEFLGDCIKSMGEIYLSQSRYFQSEGKGKEGVTQWESKSTFLTETDSSAIQIHEGESSSTVVSTVSNHEYKPLHENVNPLEISTGEYLIRSQTPP